MGNSGPQVLPAFTPEQRKVILDRLPELWQYINDNNPKKEHCHKGTSDCISHIAKEIIKTPLFSAAELAPRCPADVEYV